MFWVVVALHGLSCAAHAVLHVSKARGNAFIKLLSIYVNGRVMAGMCLAQGLLRSN